MHKFYDTPNMGVTTAPRTPLLPPEWAEQSAILLAWPHAHTDWSTNLTEVEDVYRQVAQHVTQRQDLLVVCHNAEVQARAKKQLSRAGCVSDRMHFAQAPIDDTWIRDYGPLTVFRDGKPILLDFTFDGWAGKYPATQDDAVTRCLHQQGALGNAELECVAFVLEGGSVEVDGQGSLLATRRCLLESKRNPGYTQLEVENLFRRLFGIDRFLWVSHGHLVGDDTDSHIDLLARFCDPETIVYQSCFDKDDPHFQSLQRMAEDLGDFRDYRGKPYTLIEIPLPSPIVSRNGMRLPASYVNFLIINGAVLVPTYRDTNDQIALQRLREVFPEHEVSGIDCTALIQQYGSLHCISMQLPRGVLI